MYICTAVKNEILQKATQMFLDLGFKSVTMDDLAQELAISKNVYSIKVDTNFDNLAMLHIFNKLEYQYCGQVYFRGSARRAYEKILK